MVIYFISFSLEMSSNFLLHCHTPHYSLKLISSKFNGSVIIHLYFLSYCSSTIVTAAKTRSLRNRSVYTQFYGSVPHHLSTSALVKWMEKVSLSYFVLMLIIRNILGKLFERIELFSLKKEKKKMKKKGTPVE